MKLFPNTLLGRTVLYLGALLLLVQALWFATAQYLIFTQVKPAYEQQIVDMVAMAQTLVEAQSPHAALTSVQTPATTAFETVEIIPDSRPRPELVPHGIDDIPGVSNDLLRERFGPLALSLKQKDAEVSWLRFPARGELFWLKVTLGSTRTISYAKLLFFSLEIGLAAGGAYLIVFRLTKKLRYVTEAAKAIGRGDPPGLLEAKGPEEIRSLCEGFNQMSRDLMKLESDRRLMLAGISHDLRTPLTRMRLAVELANNDIDPSMIHDIEDMDAILRQFLDYARDGSEEPIGIHDLNALVHETTQRFEIRGHAIKSELGQVPPFAFRRNSIRRVLDNLVDNAVRYGQNEVCVKTRSDGNSVFLSVSDGGPGIRSGNPSDFIKPFARENVARSAGGAGLGLAIVERVVRFHSGRLVVRNGNDRGLLVTVKLPARAA